MKKTYYIPTTGIVNIQAEYPMQLATTSEIPKVGAPLRRDKVF